MACARPVHGRVEPAGRGPGKDPGEGGIGGDDAREKAQEEQMSPGRVKNDSVNVISRYWQKVQQDGRVAEQDPGLEGAQPEFAGQQRPEVQDQQDAKRPDQGLARVPGS